MEHTGFPSDETLASFLDGKLDPETRRRVIEHMATCDECYAVAMHGGGDVVSRHVPERLNSHLQRKRAFLAAAAVAVAVLAGAILVSETRSKVAPDNIHALAIASPTHRQFDGRLTGFPYQPPSVATRGNDQDPIKHIEYAELYAVSARISGESRDQPTVANLHALGLAHLLLHQYDEAVTTLERALAPATTNEAAIHAIHVSREAAVVSDLSAALLTRWKVRGDPHDLKLAIEASQVAWSIARTPEAAWNRASALEQMHLRDDSIKAWLDYLNLDASSPWAAEAREQLKILRTHKVGNNDTLGIDELLNTPQRSDNNFLRQWPAIALANTAALSLLPQWSDAVLNSDKTTANRIWLGICLIADSNRTRLMDDQLKEMIADVECMNTEQRATIARVLHRIVGGNERASPEQQPAVLRTLTRAIGELHLLNVTDTLTMRAKLAQASYYSNELTDAIHQSTEVIDEIQRRRLRYPLLLSHALWIRGTSYSTSGLFIDALHDHQSALVIRSKMGDDSSVVGLEMNLAADYASIGDSKISWEHRLRAMAMIQRDDALRYAQLLMQAARPSIDEGFFWLPKVALDRQLTLCVTHDWLDLRLRGLLWRADLYERHGDAHAADDNRRAALECGRQIGDDAVRAFNVTTPEYIHAQFQHTHERDECAALLDAIRYAKQRHLQLRLVNLILALARKQLALGDVNSTRVTVMRAVNEIDEERSWLTSADARTFYTDGRRSAFREAVEILWQVGAKTDAFNIAERAKARTLLDLLQKHTRAPVVTSDLVMARLPKGVALVEFCVLKSRTLIWLINGSSVVSFERQITSEKLAACVHSFVLSTRTGSRDRYESILYEMLVAPWINAAMDIETIVIVADDELAALPFSALRERIGAPYVVERFGVCVTPSASVFLESETKRLAESGRRLIVAPDADRTLPASGFEAQRVREMYPKADLLIGHDATVEAFLEAARRASNIHFAGHAIDNNDVPMMSALVFAQHDARNRLYGYELASEHLPGLKIVVLSACDTEPDGDRSLQGIAGLARAFIAAGARSVLATFYSVSDSSAASCGVEFQRLIAMGERPARALREVQLAMLRSGGRVREWSAFVVSGHLDSV